MKLSKPLCVGDTMRNTAGNKTTIVGFNGLARDTVLLLSETGTEWSVDESKLISNINQGHYTNYERYKFSISDVKVGATYLNKKDNLRQITNFDEPLDLLKVYKLDTGEAISLRLKLFVSNLNRGVLSKYQLPNSKNSKDEKIRETETVKPRDSRSKAISSSTTRQIASSSRLTGNSKIGFRKRTRVGQFKISRSAITIQDH